MNSEQGENRGIMLRILGIIGKLLDNFFFQKLIKQWIIRTKYGDIERRTDGFNMATCIWLQAEEGNCGFPINFIFLAEQGGLGLAGKPNQGLRLLLFK